MFIKKNSDHDRSGFLFTVLLMIFRVSLELMDALDLLAPVDPEDCPELWDSPDPRESL